MFEIRLNELRKKLLKEKLDAVLISSVPNITYLTGYSNFFKEERDGYVLITREGSYILTHSIYSKSLDGKIPNFKVLEISRREPPEKILQKILGKTNVSIGIEESDLRVYEYKKLNKIFKNLKNFEFKINRTVKDNDEIELISKACKIGDEVFSKVLKKIKLGISEKQLVFEIESLIKKEDLDISFRTIVAFGANASAPHHESGKTKLESSQFVLMDFGIKYENYCSDMTRTVFFGKPSDKQRKIYETVLAAQKKAMDFINKFESSSFKRNFQASLIKETVKKGKAVKAADVDKVARKYIISKGYPSIPHSLGHGIGLEVHEHPHLSPKSKEELKKGMVFSIEPGIYIQGFGGVRIEDLFVLENTGLRQITTSRKSLIEI